MPSKREAGWSTNKQNKVLKKIFRNTSITLLSLLAIWLLFLSWSVGQNAAWIKLKSELFYGVHGLWFTSAICTFFILTEKKKHKGVVDYSTDSPLTHLRLTTNLISTFCNQFQLFALKKFQLSALYGINWRALSQWACWNFLFSILTTFIVKMTLHLWFNI